jgi:hypothetical protein
MMIMGLRSAMLQNIIGDVSYKLVHSVNPFNLQCKEDIAAFASVFVATLKTTLLAL